MAEDWGGGGCVRGFGHRDGKGLCVVDVVDMLDVTSVIGIERIEYTCKRTFSSASEISID